jgi:hypothetical protein
LSSADYARQAWTAGITAPPEEAAFLQRWGTVLTQDDEWARYQRLSWSSSPAAAREAERLDAKHRAMTTPAVVLAQAKALRAADDLAGATALWKQQAPAAPQAAPDHQGIAETGPRSGRLRPGRRARPDRV